MKKQMISTSAMKYKDATGVQTHSLVTLVEFTGCDYKVLKIISESGRPSWSNPLTETGAVAEAFINNKAMLARLGFTEVCA